MAVLSIVPGDDEFRTYQYKDSAGAPIDLTGYTVAADYTHDGTTTSYAATISSPATGGEVVTHLTAVQTAAIAPDGGHYRVRLTNGSGSVTTLIQGKIRLNYDRP